MVKIQDLYFEEKDKATWLLNSIRLYGWISEFDYLAFVSYFAKSPKDFEKVRYVSYAKADKQKEHIAMIFKSAYTEKDIENAQIIKVKDDFGFPYYKIEL